MEEDILETNPEELFYYVFNSSKYSRQLSLAIQNDLWEYATIVVWKTTILFIYEKLSQIKNLGHNLPKEFEKIINKNNMGYRTCFSFCCIKDDTIYSHLDEIWEGVEINFKQCFKSLLDERNGLSHVNRYEEEYDYDSFKTFFSKTLKVIKFLENQLS